MNNPRRLGQSELELIDRLSNTQLGIPPRTFLSKWDVTYEQVASICHCTVGTVTRWFGKGDNYRRPGVYPCLKLKLADLLLENYREIESRSKYSKHWQYDPHKLELIDILELEVFKKFEHYQMPVIQLHESLPFLLLNTCVRFYKSFYLTSLCNNGDKI